MTHLLLLALLMQFFPFPGPGRAGSGGGGGGDVAVNATGSIGHPSGGSVSSQTLSFALAEGSNRYLLVAVSGWTGSNWAATTTCTYAGDSMVAVTGAVVGGASVNSVKVFELKEADLDTGTADIVCTYPVSLDEVGFTAIAFDNVNQTTATGTCAAEGDSSVAVTVASGDMAVDFHMGYAASAPTVGAGQTSRASVDGFGTLWHQMSTEIGSGSITLNWSGTSDSAIAACPVKKA